MAALPDWLKKNIPKATLGTAIGAAAFAPDIAGIVTSESKLKGITKALADIWFWTGKIFAPLRQALVGGWMILGFNTISKALHALVKDTGSLEAALRRLQAVRGFERQFTNLTGGLDAAKQRVAELLTLSQRGPFKFEELATASRNLEVFTRGALSGASATRMIGSVAIASGNGIEATAGAVGNFYATLRDGQPIGSATEELRQMGVISQQTANELNDMSQHGATASEVFNTLTASLEKSHETLRDTADDLSVVTAEHQKAVEELQTKFGAPWTQEEVNSMKNGTKAILAITPALEAVSKQLATVFGGFQTGTSVLLRFTAESQTVQTAIKLIGSAFATLSVIVLTFGTVMVARALPALQALGTGAAASITSVLARIGIQATIAARAGLILTTAFRGLAALLVGGVVTAGLLAVVGILVNVGLQVKAAWDKMQQLASGFKESNDAIKEQIRLVGTLAERHEALAKAIDQSIAAEEEYHKLLRSVQSGNVGDILALVAARKAAQEAKKTVAEAAAVGPAGLGGPERKAFIEQRERERLAKEEREFQATQATAGPEGRIISARQRAGALGERAERGFRGAERRKDLAEAESDIDRRRQLAEDNKKIAEEEVKADKEQMALVKSKAAVPFAVPSQSIAGRRAQERADAAKKEIETLDREARRVRAGPQFRETAEGKGALVEQYKEELKANKNITTERKQHVLAMIELLEKQQQRLENERELAPQLKSESEELRRQADLEERALNIQRIRSTAELEAARATGSPGERARKEFEIGTRARQAELIELERQQKVQADIANQKVEAEKAKPGGGDKEVVAQLEASRDALSAQNEERTKAIRIQQDQARTAERERIRGQIVTRVQTGLETRGVQARLAGRGEEAKTAEHVGSFVSKFEQLRQQFGDAEAKKIALQQEQNEIAKEAAGYATALKPVADSLTRIGGGGGVGGPTGDPQLIIQQRQVQLAAAANQYLASIEQELRNQGAPEEGGGEAQPAQQGEQPIEGGRKAEVGESQEKVNEIERNRIAAEKIQQPAVAPPAPPATPAAGAPTPAIAPPAAPAAKPAAPAIAPPAAPAAVHAAPAVAPPAAPVPTGLNVPITQPAITAPAPAAPVAVPAAAAPAAAQAEPIAPTIAQPGYHLAPSYAEDIGKTIGTKEYPLPKLPTTGFMSATPSVSISAPGAATEQPGQGVAKPIDTASAGGERYYSPGADAARTLRDIRRDNQQANTYLDNISGHADKAGKTL